MAVPQYRDEVLVTLSSVNPPSDFAFPDRRFFLTKEKPVMEIGRTSKRNSSFEAAKSNAWFDSAVMSRTHARFELDVEKQKVYIKDTGSLHGTFKNNQRLVRNASSILTTGDRLKFGIPIDRGMDRYPPCNLDARLKFGTISPDNRPKVFRVPDDTDVEDSSSDDDDQVRNSYEILHAMKICPAAFPPSSPSRSPIDLTTNDQYPLSSVRDDVDNTAEPMPPFPSTLKDAMDTGAATFKMRAPDEQIRNSPEGDWSFSDLEDDDDEINLSQSTDMDTENSHGEVSDDESVDYLPSPIALNYDDDEGAIDVDEEDFEEHDEFEENECMEHQRQYSVIRVDLFLDDHDLLDDPVDPTNQGILADLPAADETGMDAHTPIVNDVTGESQAVSVDSLDPGSLQQTYLGKSSAQVGAVDYLLNKELPPIETFVIPASTMSQTPLTLPSISEAMTLSRYHASQNHELRTPAEIMGERTGKYDYFAARAENKANALVSCPQPRSQALPKARLVLSNQPKVQRFLLAEPVPEQEATFWPESQATSHVVDSQPSKQTDVPTLALTSPVTQMAGSDLATSGAEFLNTPPQESEAPFPATEPALDETSAYQFEMSKMAADATKASTQTSEAHPEPTKKTMDTSDPVEPSSHDTPLDTKPVEPESMDTTTPDLPETPQLAKRKAEDISQLTPEEERLESHSTRRLHRERLDSRVNSKSRANKAARAAARAAASTTTAPPPTKRLRRVAEVFGYAALGGVAVMSALIATAPTL
ncbi:hypothetical protein FZEAL_2877 [Fusarium zealandicum]|uniref:FHA domain-containing protein n=1 Tax=Fusarium zealandicum TaxID=1053134 RepID=A0A8H4UPY3_9HYPO|nr:hypothetical protein FZEAL_2877 [Fusarium zealandicum]